MSAKEIFRHQERIVQGRDLCIAGGRPESVGLLKPVGDQMMSPQAPDVGNGVSGYVFVLLDFYLVLVRLVLVLPPSFPLGIGIFNLSHCLLEARNLI